MKIKRKVDSSFRINLPKELMDQLNWSKGDIVELSIENNKVILVRQENALEVNLEPQKEEPRLNNILSIVKDKIPAIEESVTIKINKNPVEERCHQCLKPLEGSKFLLNGRYICRKCRDELKGQLLFDILHKE